LLLYVLSLFDYVSMRMNLDKQKTQLNLARKWRSQSFDQIIGQDVSVRILKNSLYLNHFFPVYLFAGQRGCGKTTTARVFASAINCEQFDHFRQNPKEQVIPCLHCASCKAMLAGKHPDFIEMDAASHTGVDNVRQIIDASSLLPLMGRKKIYLIDEAHMLSKAAFNAFLKILEEPPASALFILATTDTQKIIETVRSRCFQLFFKSIDSTVLLGHLQNVCQQEQIVYDDEGLSLIISETEGSARDALNMLESVRFSAARVDKQAVLHVLGHIDNERLFALLKHVLNKDVPRLLKTLHAIDRSQCSAAFMWQHFLRLLHTCIRIKHGITTDAFASLVPDLKKLLQKVHWKVLYQHLSQCYEHEMIFNKASDQHAFFEMMLLQLCAGAFTTYNDDDTSSGCSSPAQMPVVQEVQDECDELDEQEDEQEDDADEVMEFSAVWKQCVHAIAALGDPLIASIFKQSQFTSFDQQSGMISIAFEQRFSFFQDSLQAAQDAWLPVIKKHFGPNAHCNSLFTAENAAVAKKVVQPAMAELPKKRPTAQPQQAYTPASPPPRRSSPKSAATRSSEVRLDVSDKEVWPHINMVLQHFPGTVYEMKEQQHG